MLERCIRLGEAYGANPKALAMHLNDLALVFMQLSWYEEALAALQRSRIVVGEPDSGFALLNGSRGGRADGPAPAAPLASGAIPVVLSWTSTAASVEGWVV